MRIQRIPAMQEKADPAQNQDENNIDLSLISKLIDKYKNQKGNLIPLLQGAQEVYGYIPEVVFKELSVKTGLELNELYGVATFYSQFRLTPAGKFIIKMCHGTACHVQSVSAITEDLMDLLNVKDGETTTDGIFTLETVACLGCCSLAPVMMINGETYGKLTPRQASKIIKEIRRETIAKEKSKN